MPNNRKVQELIEKFNKYNESRPSSVFYQNTPFIHIPSHQTDSSNAPQNGVHVTSPQNRLYNDVTDKDSFSEDDTEEYYEEEEYEDDDDDNDPMYDVPQFGRGLNSQNIIAETKQFLQEEEAYCELLKKVVEDYINKIKTAKYDTEELHRIFGRLDRIHSFENYPFLSDLHECKNVSKIADCFIKHKRFFETYYDSYFKNQPNMLFVMSENPKIFKNNLNDDAYEEYIEILRNAPNKQIQSYRNFFQTMKSILEDNRNVNNFERVLSIMDDVIEGFSGEDEKVRYIISEIAQTENSYIEKLAKLTHHLIPKIEGTISKQRQKSVIGNIPTIYAQQIRFNSDLRRCLFAFNPNDVGQCFLRHKKNFMLYIKDLQMRNKPEDVDECTKLLKQQNEWEFDLQAPLNRLTKYKVLLQELAKTSDKCGLACEKVQEAYDLIEGIISKMNAVAAINSVVNENIYLCDQGDLLLRTKLKVEHNRDSYEGQVFLFEKSIVFTREGIEGPQKSLRYVYYYKHHIIMKYLEFDPNVKSQTMFSVSFRGGNARNSVKLHANNVQMKMEWIKALQSVTDKRENFHDFEII